MKIVKLEPSKHKQGWWLVWMGDGALLRLGEGDVAELSLYAGKELTEEEGAALAAAGERSRLMERALGQLSLRPMSRKELLDKLCAPPRPKKEKKPSGGPEGMETPSWEQPSREELQAQSEALRARAEAVADRLTELGLLNDGEYAGNVVRHYAAKGFGPRKIRDELYRRGVPREFWDDALGETETEESALDALVRKKLRGAEPTRENLKKASDYLARRGFGWEDISEALERYKAEWED